LLEFHLSSCAIDLFRRGGLVVCLFFYFNKLGMVVLILLVVLAFLHSTVGGYFGTGLILSVKSKEFTRLMAGIYAFQISS
jgi:hypothetical protein